MTALAAWVQGPGGTILLPALMLILGLYIGSVLGWHRGRKRLLEEQAAVREGVRAARQFRAMRAELHHEPGQRAWDQHARQALAVAQHSTYAHAAFAGAIDAPEPWEAGLDQAIADMHAGMDAWRAEHGLSQ